MNLRHILNCSESPIDAVGPDCRFALAQGMARLRFVLLQVPSLDRFLPKWASAKSIFAEKAIGSFAKASPFRRSLDSHLSDVPTIRLIGKGYGFGCPYFALLVLVSGHER